MSVNLLSNNNPLTFANNGEAGESSHCNKLTLKSAPPTQENEDEKEPHGFDIKTPLESALEHAEMGKFHTLILIPCMMAFSTTSMVPNILNNIGYTVQCDFQFVEDDKEAINKIVCMCMFAGGIIWPLMADAMSRKWTLIVVLLINTVSSLSLSSSRTFLYFGFFRGMGSFSLTGIAAVTVAYLAEFQNRYYRANVVCCLQLAWIFGIITIPQLKLFWLTRISLASLPPFFAIVGLLYFPDPPRFLLNRGREEEAFKSLHVVHAMNAGRKHDKYLVPDVASEKFKRNTALIQSTRRNESPRLLICHLVLLFSQFMLLFSYATLSSRFPNLNTRGEPLLPERNSLQKNCRAGYEKSATAITNAASLKPCEEQSVKIEEYYSGRQTIIAFCCVPAVIVLLFLVNSCTKKIYIIFPHLLLGLLILLSSYVQTEAQSLVFSCFYEALTLMSVTAGQCLALDFSPTRFRALGVGVVIGCGQLGFLLGNLGLIVQFIKPCVLLMWLSACGVIISGLLVIIIPDTTRSVLK